LDFVHKSYFLNDKDSINSDNSKSTNSNSNSNTISNSNSNNNNNYTTEEREDIGDFNDNDNDNNNKDNKDEEIENIKNNKIFKFSSLDLLLNPLRKKHVFELWNPFEIALFESCVCKFNKNFDVYPKIVIFFNLLNLFYNILI
jgi:hypothetical protein